MRTVPMCLSLIFICLVFHGTGGLVLAFGFIVLAINLTILTRITLTLVNTPVIMDIKRMDQVNSNDNKLQWWNKHSLKIISVFMIGWFLMLPPLVALLVSHVENSQPERWGMFNIAANAFQLGMMGVVTVLVIIRHIEGEMLSPRTRRCAHLVDEIESYFESNLDDDKYQKPLLNALVGVSFETD
jgi:hypothetical protein